MEKHRHMKSAALLIDKGKNVLEALPESPPPPTTIGLVDRLVLKLATGYTIPVYDELKRLGIERPNTVLLLNNNGQYHQKWTEGSDVQIDLDKEHLAHTTSPRPFEAVKAGDKMTLMLGWVDPSPRPLTKGGFVAMWVTQLEVVGLCPSFETVL